MDYGLRGLWKVAALCSIRIGAAIMVYYCDWSRLDGLKPLPVCLDFSVSNIALITEIITVKM